MTETQERFLKAVADRVPLDRVAEVYLFPAIRQGGVETGIAVVAAQADRKVATALDAEHPPAVDGTSEAVVGSAAPDAGVAPSNDGGAGGVAGAAADQAVAGTTALGAPPVGGPADLAIGDASAAPGALPVAPRADLAGVGAGAAGEDAPGGPPQQHDTADGADEHHHGTAGGIIAPPAVADERPGAPGRPGEADDVEGSDEGAGPVRHTIFSARYRLALKGPDRGKWEVDVVAEADAPLVTVDAIVRGIRKRTGEAADAERVPPDVLRGLAAQPA
jgi:hypothetical protein